MATAPRQLMEKPQALANQEHVKAMTYMRSLPRELLMQQGILNVGGLVDCFHCNGTGAVSGASKSWHHAQKAKEIFQTIDLDGDGTVDREELLYVLEVVTTGNMSAKDIDSLVLAFDTNGDGVIQFNEFVDWLFAPGVRQKAFRTRLAHAMLPQTRWLYQEKAGSWAVFDPKIAATLSEASAEGVGAAMRVKGENFEYVVDLDSMTQKNTKTGKERKVLRISDGQDKDASTWESCLRDKAAWYCGKHPFDDDISFTLEIAWQAHQAGALENTCLPLRTRGQVYEFDVAAMTQTNAKSGKKRDIRRETAPPLEESTEPSLVRIPSGMALPKGSCWVCRGSGRTSKWLEPIADAGKFDDLAPDEGELPDCLVCYSDAATYGVSTMCDHYLCDDCIRGSLQAILEAGQFPAYCPMCRAESAGAGELEGGRIDEPALTFLQQRGVITKAFQFRFQKQQNKALEMAEANFFACPAKCGAFLLQSDAEYYIDPESGEAGVRLCTCPCCDAFICPKCEALVPAAGSHESSMPFHKCEDLAAKMAAAGEADVESLALMAAIGKKCPVCATFIEKNEGCDYMMCGTKSHGSLSEAIRNAGCGIAFVWTNLEVCDDPCGWHDLDGTHRRGRPVTAMQLRGMGHPKCKRPECPFFKTVDGIGPGLPFHNGEGTQGRNNGGDYCCDMCAKDGSHQVFCHAYHWKP